MSNEIAVPNNSMIPDPGDEDLLNNDKVLQPF
jgi:hypothetical protein